MTRDTRIQTLLAGAALGMILVDRDGRLIECDEVFAGMIGHRPDELVGRALAEVAPTKNMAEEDPLHRFFIGDGDSKQVEKRFFHRDGAPVWCRMTLSRVAQSNDDGGHVIGIVENVTDRKLAQQALRESEQTLRGLIENLPDMIAVTGADWSIRFINRIPPGMDSKEVIGRSAMEFLPPEEHWKYVEARRRMLETREVQTVEIVDKAGLSWITRIVPFSDGSDSPDMLLICTDATECKAAAEAVWKEQESLRRMLELFERDRELIAFEIHDGFSQQLTGALFNFEAARQLGFFPSQENEGVFDRGMQLLRESIAEARRLVRGLRPPVLDAFGIVPAVEHLVEDHETAGGGRVEFTTLGLEQRLAHPLESALFRTVQETLNNARKHSRSDRIRIHLSQNAKHVSVEIRDWGVGFDPEQVGDDQYGLRGIRERARLLGGTARIESKPGEGTRVYVELPLLFSPQERGERGA